MTYEVKSEFRKIAQAKNKNFLPAPDSQIYFSELKLYSLTYMYNKQHGVKQRLTEHFPLTLT